MDKLTKDILGLPNKAAILELEDFYFEIQEATGGIGSSKRLNWNILAAAVNAALLPLQHSALTDLGDDDHPQYLNNERGDLRYTPLSHIDPVADPNPHPQYQTEVEIDTQIDDKVLALKAEIDPFPQYATDAQLSAEVAAAVAPIAEQKVEEYIAAEGQTLIEQEVTTQLPALINNNVVSVGSIGGVLTLDLALGKNFVVSLTENVTDIQITNLPAAGIVAELDIDFVQDAVGGRTVVLPASFKALGGSDIAVLATANAVTVLVAKSKDTGVVWRYAMQESA